MKKSLQKMSLSRETLGLLTSPVLRNAIGAYGTMETQCCDTMHQCTIYPCRLSYAEI